MDAGIPSHFITVRRGGHGDFDELARERIAQFFAKYLQGRGVAVSTEAIEMPYPDGAPPDRRRPVKFFLHRDIAHA